MVDRTWQEHFMAKVLVADFLTDARWTRGILSKDKEGNEVYHDSPDACRWCLKGALRKVSNDDVEDYEEAELWILAILEKEGLESIEDWNDAPGRTAAQVRRLLKRAAKLDREGAD